jgi:N-acetylglucosaminylphosphatidylinositol deacetylase
MFMSEIEHLNILDAAFACLLLINVYLLAISIAASRNKSWRINDDTNTNTSTNTNTNTTPDSPLQSSSSSTSQNKTHHDNILFVIAHPDDESMFFVPTIRTLVDEPDSSVHILCLSTGNFDGLGASRTLELHACCTGILGIDNKYIRVIDDPVLQDGKGNVWLKEDVAKQVSVHVNLWNITKIVTFDDYGVSGHENHCDTSRGVVHFYQTSKWGAAGTGHNIYQLESTHMCRKYSGMFDVLRSVTQSGSQCFCSLAPWINYAAMQAHFSQFVWYRRLFVVFSRYTYVNNLMKLPPREKVAVSGKED